MTIVVLSKNGEIFLPHCLKSIRNIGDTIRIIIADSGYRDKKFLDRMKERFNVEVLTSKPGQYNWLDQVIDSVSESRVFTIHDSMQIKSFHYFDDLENTIGDMRSWIALPDHRIGTTTVILNEMINFLPEELWIEPGSTFSIGYNSMEVLKLIRSDPFILDYCARPIEPFGHVVERLLPLYLKLTYGISNGYVTTYDKMTHGTYKGINFLESDTAIKYQGSSLLGVNRDVVISSSIFTED